MGVCNCSMFCCTLLYVHSSIAIILMGKRDLIALLNLSSWCLVMVERLFLVVPRGCLQVVIVVFPDHTHLLFLEFVHQIKVLSIKFRKGFAKFMIPIALFKKFLSYQFISSVEVSNMARCSSKTNELRDIDSIGCRERNTII